MSTIEFSGWLHFFGLPFPRLLTVTEVAEAVRTTRKAVYALIQRGRLPGVIRLQRRR